MRIMFLRTVVITLAAAATVATSARNGPPATPLRCLDPAGDFTGQTPTPGADATHTFVRAAGGDGSFGTWVVGPTGLPEYAYTLDQLGDPRADWPNTELRVRRDHWHLVGNRRIDATVFNEGYVEVYVQERGHELLTRYDEASGNLGGGYSMIAEEGRPGWLTAYARRPPASGAARSFGMGYARMAICHDGLVVTHTLTAPAGDHPFVVDEIRIENAGAEPRALVHYEIWDVNRHYMQTQLLRSGTLNPSAPAVLDAERVALNDKFILSASGDATHARLRHRLIDPSGAPPREAHADDDFYPPDVYLADLDGEGSRFITDGPTFWGLLGPCAQRREACGDPSGAGELTSRVAIGQPGVLVAERAVTVPPRGEVTLRYAFGAVPQDTALPDLGGATAAVEQHVAATAGSLVYLDTGDEVLKREMAWHSYYLQALGGAQDYFEHAVVNQGSAYWWGHGLDGAVRDYVFSAVALVYVDSALARETLLYAARMRREDTRALSYATGSFGELSDAVIHDKPSDLELFLWWGLAEYVFATGDRSILAEAEPFWPKETSAPRPITEHISTGARYLIDDIGVGAHGLLKLGSGDWDDSITFFATSRDIARAEGESVANTAMATLVIPWAAALLDGADDATAAELRRLATDLRVRLAEQWTGRWYRRAWFGPDEPFGDDVVFLLHNAFALAGENPTAEQGATLVDNLQTYLGAPSTTSMMQFWYLDPPAEPIEGVTDAGSASAILVALGVWGIARVDPALAWATFRHSTMAVKADAYPDLWYGIWSAADAQYTNVHPQAGQTWASFVTPQKDFPIMNSNAHAGPLIGALRAVGIEPALRMRGGLITPCLAIRPKLPASAGHPIVLDTPLVRVDLGEPHVVKVRYRPIVDGSMHFLFAAPPGTTQVARLTIDGQDMPVGDAEVVVQQNLARGVPIDFEIYGAN